MEEQPQTVIGDAATPEGCECELCGQKGHAALDCRAFDDEEDVKARKFLEEKAENERKFKEFLQQEEMDEQIGKLKEIEERNQNGKRPHPDYDQKSRRNNSPERKHVRRSSSPVYVHDEEDEEDEEDEGKGEQFQDLFPDHAAGLFLDHAAPLRNSGRYKYTSNWRKDLDDDEELDDDVNLNAEQQRALDLAMDAESFFFTGSAGTGKSFLLREIVKRLRKKYGSDCVYVTASTGIAACNISGCTLHSFAGVGLGEGDREKLLGRVMGNRWARERWEDCLFLVVDEVSMIDADFFDLVEYIARRVRGNDLPFGGITLILSGDFLQLPPVQKDKNEIKKFCFEAKSWPQVIKKTLLLHEVFRQRDNKFVKLLNEVRMGRVTNEALDVLKECLVPFERRRLHATVEAKEDNNKNEAEKKAQAEDERKALEDIKPTKLYPHNRDVEAENKRQLDVLPGKTYTFKAKDTGDAFYLPQLQKNCAAKAVLELKVGAQVILLKNLDTSRELVNGSRGVVASMVEMDDMVLPEVLFSNGSRQILFQESWTIEIAAEVKATRMQFPLNLAWALSIHKAQGMSISKVEMKLRHVFEYGQAYVALSRATTLAGLHIVDFDQRGFRAHPKVGQYYTELTRKAKNTEQKK